MPNGRTHVISLTICFPIYTFLTPTVSQATFAGSILTTGCHSDNSSVILHLFLIQLFIHAFLLFYLLLYLSCVSIYLLIITIPIMSPSPLYLHVKRRIENVLLVCCPSFTKGPQNILKTIQTTQF